MSISTLALHCTGQHAPAVLGNLNACSSPRHLSWCLLHDWKVHHSVVGTSVCCTTGHHCEKASTSRDTRDTNTRVTRDTELNHPSSGNHCSRLQVTTSLNTHVLAEGTAGWNGSSTLTPCIIRSFLSNDIERRSEIRNVRAHRYDVDVVLAGMTQGFSSAENSHPAWKRTLRKRPDWEIH